MFAVDRTQGLQATGESFQRPASFDASEYLAGSLGVMRGEQATLSIRFSYEHARYIAEHPQHASQERLGQDSEGDIQLNPGRQSRDYALGAVLWFFCYSAKSS